MGDPRPDISPTPSVPTPSYISEMAFFSAAPPPPVMTNPPIPSVVPEHEKNTSRRSTRIHFPTWKVRESLPEPITFPPDLSQPAEPHPTCQVFLLVREKVTSIKNKFGLLRAYKGLSSCIPDTTVNLESTYEPAPPPPSPPKRTIKEIISPYPNLSSFLFDHQFWTSTGKKSQADWDQLSKLMAHPDFKQEDIIGVNFRSIEEKLKGRSSKASWEQEKGWRSKPLTI